MDKVSLRDIYRNLEKTRLSLWELLKEEDTLQRMAGIDTATFTEQMVCSELIGNVVKITIYDILPRNCDFNSTQLQYHWGRLMKFALQDLKITFDKAMVVIIVYTPSITWDTDNRVIKFILDSIRHHGIVPNDSARYLSHLVMGEVSRNARTEIYIGRHPTNPLQIYQL